MFLSRGLEIKDYLNEFNLELQGICNLYSTDKGVHLHPFERNDVKSKGMDIVNHVVYSKDIFLYSLSRS